MKDMPAISPKGLICGAIPDREDPRDVLVSKMVFSNFTTRSQSWYKFTKKSNEFKSSKT